MKSIRKIITAAAAAAVITTVGATTAFALSDAADQVDEEAFVEVFMGDDMFMSCTYGVTEVRNQTSTTRYCVAYVEARNYYTNAELDSDYKYGNCNPNEIFKAEVSSQYIGSNYGYYWTGSIRGGATPQATVVESHTYTYPEK